MPRRGRWGAPDPERSLEPKLASRRTQFRIKRFRLLAGFRLGVSSSRAANSCAASSKAGGPTHLVKVFEGPHDTSEDQSCVRKRLLIYVTRKARSANADLNCAQLLARLRVINVFRTWQEILLAAARLNAVLLGKVPGVCKP